MAQLKPTASLSSGLLARKGQARPAMRPQGLSGFGTMADQLEDLGWNDMGPVDEPLAHHGPRPELTPMDSVAATPAVLRQREALREEIETRVPAPVVPAEPVAAEIAEAPQRAAPARTPRKSVSVATATRIGRETSGKGKGRKRRNATGKVAFTLRLDADRHLRLRLATALCNRSAQVLVTEALDQLLDTLPEVEDLVRQLPHRD
ncbi:hypothetical protein ACFO8O_03470 [Hephaestia sp. GCM10023244]|uniref:hypothetical protein n=1 Tax=unclassified Hephaestia TaxID=2631281 RepID=UPI00207704BE|nr:hypothetical protein [Hephaestia sp. MAHUQ-44]MCM8730029.1 hypothetical protein [Hephaestia sp. MAHUQ-44]